MNPIDLNLAACSSLTRLYFVPWFFFRSAPFVALFAGAEKMDCLEASGDGKEIPRAFSRGLPDGREGVASVAVSVRLK